MTRKPILSRKYVAVSQSFLLAVLIIGALAMTMVMPAPAAAAPKPELVQRSWQFDFKADIPRAIAVKNLRGQYEWFWYVTYKVENNTDRERLFIPEIVISTDKGNVVSAGRGVPTRVFTAIKAQVGNRLLESPIDVVGRLLRGEDHAKESVAVWPAFKHNVDTVNIFVGGISGETKVVVTPDPADPSKTKEFVLQKTLQHDFDFPGAPLSPQDQEVTQKKKPTWIMR